MRLHRAYEYQINDGVGDDCLDIRVGAHYNNNNYCVQSTSHAASNIAVQTSYRAADRPGDRISFTKIIEYTGR